MASATSGMLFDPRQLIEQTLVLGQSGECGVAPVLDVLNLSVNILHKGIDPVVESVVGHAQIVELFLKILESDN